LLRSARWRGSGPRLEQQKRETGPPDQMQVASPDLFAPLTNQPFPVPSYAILFLTRAPLRSEYQVRAAEAGAVVTIPGDTIIKRGGRKALAHTTKDEISRERHDEPFACA
jgi:hypothetical protein